MWINSQACGPYHPAGKEARNGPGSWSHVMGSPKLEKAALEGGIGAVLSAATVKGGELICVGAGVGVEARPETSLINQ